MARRTVWAEFNSESAAILVASFVVLVFTTGTTRCTGVLFSAFQNEFASSSAQTGAISSIILASSYYGGTLGGALGNRYGVRLTTMAGGAVSTVAMIGASLTQNIYQMYVMGALSGFASGMTFTPAVVIVAQYFKTSYSVAVGIITMGDSVGLMAFGPLSQLLVDAYGWRGTILVTGAMAANVVLAGAAFRPVKSSQVDTTRKGIKTETLPDGKEIESTTYVQQEPRNGTPRRLSRKVDATRPLRGLVKILRLKLMWQSYRFSLFCVAQSAFSLTLGCYLIYIIPWATMTGVSDQDASYLLVAFGIISMIGRPLCGIINRRIHSQVIYQVSMLVTCSGVLVAQLQSHTGFVLSACITGLAIGFQRTTFIVLIREYVGVDNMGSAVGLSLAILGTVNLVGPILSGALYDATDSFSPVFYLLSGSSLLSFLLMFLAPYLQKVEPGIYTGLSIDV